MVITQIYYSSILLSLWSICFSILVIPGNLRVCSMSTSICIFIISVRNQDFCYCERGRGQRVMIGIIVIENVYNYGWPLAPLIPLGMTSTSARQIHIWEPIFSAFSCLSEYNRVCLEKLLGRCSVRARPCSDRLVVTKDAHSTKLGGHEFGVVVV